MYRDRQEKGGPKISIFRQLAEVGIQLKKTDVKRLDNFEDAKSIGATCGVFTLAQDFSEEFEDFLKNNLPPEYDTAAKEWSKSKVLAGRMVAQQAECPEEVEFLYAQILFRLDVPSGSAHPVTRDT